MTGLHGYKTFALGVLVTAGFFAGYLFGQAATVVATTPGFMLSLAALVGANEAANVFKDRAGRPTTVNAETAEVTGGPVTVAPPED
ncbi:MAG TPA: hypothetical protein VF576_01615 [Rubricoccaceae bacterium]